MNCARYAVLDRDLLKAENLPGGQLDRVLRATAVGSEDHEFDRLALVMWNRTLRERIYLENVDYYVAI